MFNNYGDMFSRLTQAGGQPQGGMGQRFGLRGMFGGMRPQMGQFQQGMQNWLGQMPQYQQGADANAYGNQMQTWAQGRPQMMPGVRFGGGGFGGGTAG